jgi:hypothetical protein
VSRKPGDAYCAALQHAEITAISGVEKLRFTDEELDTPWNRQHRAMVDERRSERAAMREEREQARKRDAINDYAIAKGRESPPPGYRPRRARPVAFTQQPTVGIPAARPTAGLEEDLTVEELIAALGGT